MRRRVALLMIPAGILLLGAAPAVAQTGTATVTIVHGLPRFTADIYVDGKLLLDGFKPESATQPLEVPAGTHEVAIRPVGAAPDSEPVLQGSVTFTAGENYSIVAHYDRSEKPHLSVFQNDVSPVPAGMTRLVIRNTATPPPVDLRAEGASGQSALFSGLASGQDVERDVNAGRYSFQLFRSGSDKALFGPQSLSLAEGAAYVLYVVGSAPDTIDLMVQPIHGLASNPGGVFSGSGGLAADRSISPLVIALLAAGALGVLVSLNSIVRRRGWRVP